MNCWIQPVRYLKFIQLFFLNTILFPFFYGGENSTLSKLNKHLKDTQLIKDTAISNLGMSHAQAEELKYSILFLFDLA